VHGGCSVGVVVPAYNEERQIGKVLETMPDFVDHIIVVDDRSSDATLERCREWQERLGRRLTVIEQPKRQGVGAAITSGYRRSIDLGIDVVAVMAGDGQMDPDDLPALLEPIADDAADYVKGNRFMHPAVWSEMPPARIVGNVVLSAATRVTSGYRHVFDSQCGYTAIARRALEELELDQLQPRYGYPNDLLSRLNVAGMRVTDVPVRPIYGPHWKSGIRLGTALGPIPWVLLRSWGNRLAAASRKRAVIDEA